MIFEGLKKPTSIIKIEKKIFYEIFSSIKGCIGGFFFPSFLVTINKSVCLGGKLKINLDFLPTNQLTRFHQFSPTIDEGSIIILFKSKWLLWTC